VSGRFLNTIRSSTKAGSKLSFATYGTNFSLVADKCATCEQVKIYIDGALNATVDTKASSTLAKQIVWNSVPYSLGAKHTISVVVVGTSGRPTVRIDGLMARR